MDGEALGGGPRLQLESCVHPGRELIINSASHLQGTKYQDIVDGAGQMNEAATYCLVLERQTCVIDVVQPSDEANATRIRSRRQMELYLKVRRILR